MRWFTNKRGFLKNPLPCDICGQKFWKLAHLVTHMVIFHSRKEHKSSYSDKLVNIVTRTRQAPVKRMVHKFFPRTTKLAEMRMEKKVEKKSYSCNDCHRVFRDEELFLKHLHTPKPYDPSACDLCGQKFASWALLSEHRLIHLSHVTAA